MSDPHALDRRLVRRAFVRAATGYDAAAAVPREIGERMLSRLDLLRAVPARILDLGSGTGYCARALRTRYAHSEVVELDSARAMLGMSQRHAPWWRRGLALFSGSGNVAVCGDIERLPFADRSFDMVWSNLVLHWLCAPEPALAEMYRVLRPGGVCLFSTLGPDTLKELRDCYAEIDRHVHVHRFIDLHDLGDMLVHTGYADPVMDMEYLLLTYADVKSLMRELKSLGAGNIAAGRNTALSGRRAYAAMCAAYDRLRRRDGRLPATLEVVYGHAWRPERERNTVDGRSVMQFHPRRQGASP